MLDEQDAESVVRKVTQQAGELLPLGIALTGCRLVEQKDLRIGGQRPCNLDEPGLARGEQTGAHMGDRPEPDSCHQWRCDATRRCSASTCA